MTLAKIYTNRERIIIDLDRIYWVRVYCTSDKNGFIQTIEVSIDNSLIVFRVDIDSHKYCLPIKHYSNKLKQLVTDELFNLLTKKQTDINIYSVVMPVIYQLREIDDNA